LGIGDWGLGPIPNPQSPIPNPQSPMLTYFCNILSNKKFFEYFNENSLIKILNKKYENSQK